jgi:hypothetical protein
MRKQLPPKTPDKPSRLAKFRGVRGMERSCPECGAKAGQLHKPDCSRAVPARIKLREKPDA